MEGWQPWWRNGRPLFQDCHQPKHQLGGWYGKLVGHLLDFGKAQLALAYFLGRFAGLPGEFKGMTAIGLEPATAIEPSG
jgi:hypothetical protein